MSKIKEFKKWLEERTEQMVGWDELEKKLRKKEKIKIKYGADPTKRDLHLGHAVSLRIMRRLQDEFDAEIQFLIGDFTAKVGDPTGKSKARPVLTDEQMKLNAETYATQIFRILDEKKMSTWCNGEKLAFVDNCQGGWWNNMKLPEFMNLLTLVTHARLIDRDMFQERIKNNQEIYMHEMMYPI
ncbi:tyrosine--tRNA ligase, partial [Patescibacteria group bacterium]|nr:tyrosine--tRNA ligase [Patescibacteria group bacterium]